MGEFITFANGERWPAPEGARPTNQSTVGSFHDHF
jgi:hypothetical protein